MNEQAEFLINILPRWQRSALEYLIQTEREFNEFMVYYESEKINPRIRNGKLEHSSRIKKAMIKYRIDRMTKISISFDKFKELYDKDPFKAFTTLYQQSVPDDIFKMIIEKINSGQVALKHYYEYPQLNPEEFLRRLATRIIDEESLDLLRRIKLTEKEAYNQKEEENNNT